MKSQLHKKYSLHKIDDDKELFKPLLTKQITMSTNKKHGSAHITYPNKFIESFNEKSNNFIFI